MLAAIHHGLCLMFKSTADGIYWTLLMMMFKKLPVYLREFGVGAGTMIFRAVEMASRDDSGRILSLSVPGYGHRIFVRDTVADRSTFWQCLVQRQYDLRRFPQHARLIEQYEESLRQGKRPLIIDCGANIGLAAAWFAREFPEASIVCIEPDDANLELLRMNTRSFEGRVTIIKGGVWNKPGTLRIVNPDSGAAAFRVDYSEESNVPGAIQAYTVNDLCSFGGSDYPLVVKLDIEGSQAQLFASDTDWVGRTGLITLELDDWLLPWQGTSRNFFTCLSCYPFDYLLGGESIFCFRDSTSQTGYP